jgi:hypothetical protein
MANGNWSHIQKQKGHKSGLETKIAEQLNVIGVNGEYEQHEINYTIPATQHTYKPDFKLPNGIYIESKGWFLPEDRKKHILIKEQNPNIDLRFIFQSPNSKIYKGSKTTYAQWCGKHGFKWAKGSIPDEWLSEPPKIQFF